MTLLNKLKQLPNNPGIYQYFDKTGKLLYIGKAKILKNRVKSYFQFTPILAPSKQLSARIYKMIQEVENLEYIVVKTENDALILENSLIKQLKPKYNILLRDDKTYPYIYLDTNEDFPRLDITRKVLDKKGIKYFGPFSSGAKDMLNSIYDILPLVQKKSCVKGGKACLFYQMKKCLAPCEQKVTKDEYQKLINQALTFIHNKTKLIEYIEQRMIQYSSECRFEEALILRDRIKTIEKSQIKSTLDFANKENLDLFSVEIKNEMAVVVKMFIRDGKLISTSHNFIRITEISSIQEIYKTALINYYGTNLPIIPKEILVAHELDDIDELVEFIYNKHKKKVSIISAKIGRKKELQNIALKNCNELLKTNKELYNNTIYITLKELFNLNKVSYRFECFDNSHIMGQATVGAMVVWDNNQFIKDEYRLYNLEARDEYGQMKEMLTRRVESFIKNSPPDVWIIDGGKTLLNLAFNITKSVGVDIDIIGIAKEKIDKKAHRAKGKAKDIIYTKDKTFKLETSDKRLQFIQRLRDESHRSAINFHKKQKRKEDKQISLLQIKGIGEAKVQKLLNFFGTFEQIKTSSLLQLNEIVNEKDALKIFNHFHTN